MMAIATKCVSSSTVTYEFSDFAVQGPRTAQRVVQSFARDGHDPVTYQEVL